MSSKIIQTSFSGDPNLGLYGFATSSYVLSGVKNRNLKKMKKPVYDVHLYSTNFAGIFASGNSTGIVLPYIVRKHEIEKLCENIKVLVLKTDHTAVGNLILMNDNGIILSPLLKDSKKEIDEFFEMKSVISTIAGLSIVGSCAVATEKGCLVHPNATKQEIAILKQVLNVECDIGTVNFGSPYVRTGLIANNETVLASTLCSGPELGRIVEALGFL